MQQTEKLKLTASVRDPKTGSPKKLRKLGRLPAVLYGEGIKSQGLEIIGSDFEKIFKKAGESTLVELQTPDGKTHPVIIHEVQRHYLTTKPQHVDFYQVSMSKKLKAKVPLEFTGEAKAVKELGGVLVKVLNEAEVECLPQDLPHNIVVNISSLNAFSDAITISNLQVSDKVKILTPKEEVVAKVQAPREIEEIEQKPVEDVAAVEGAAEEKSAPAEETGKKAEVQAKSETKTENPKK